ncbi:MAG TPA: hypothetical protein H9994_00405, partial [Candidatus Salinicoccus merdavium]|nr:hypothetical protein [Candidatus Salinicoccus merdavium]
IDLTAGGEVMKEVVVGIITTPGLPKKLLEDILDRLNDMAGNSIDEEIDWQVEHKTDILTSSAEFVNEIFKKLESIKKGNDWDMAIAIGDLPSISNRKAVLSDFDHEEKTSLISVPALGVFKSKKKLEMLLLYHMEVLYGKGESEDTEAIQPNFISKLVDVTPKEDGQSKHRHVIKSTLGGWLRLVTGMTYLNEPWKEFSNFKTIVALAFATGTYISIFRTPWELSLDYSMWRFILLMIIAIFGMVGWLIYAHNLWEKRTTENQPAYRRLYNFTTILTLLILTLVNYIVVSLLLVISILIFVPMGLFETWTDVEVNVTWPDYLTLIWFTSSLGVLAGAFGSTVEEEDKIRNITYSYRQLFRYRQLEEEKEDDQDTPEDEEHSDEKQSHEKDEKDEEYSGEKQSHDEDEEGK